MDLTIQENKVSIGTVYNYTSINLYIFVKKLKCTNLLRIMLSI